MGSTKKRKSASNIESDQDPENLNTVKEEVEEEVPIKEVESEESDEDEQVEETKKPQQEEKLPQESKISKTLSE